MLLPSQRATLCLGPFKDDEDWARKIREDNAKEEADRQVSEAELRRLIRRKQKDHQEEEYRINRMLSDLLSSVEEQKDDD